jgi:hypothetical protein
VTVIFTAKKAAALGLGKKPPLSLTPPEDLAAYRPRTGDFLYLDISGMDKKALARALGALKKTALPWGVIDPKGEAADPAEFFFSGAADYLGPKAIKAGVKEKRLAAARAWKTPGTPEDKGQEKEKAKEKAPKPRAGDAEKAEKSLPLLEGLKLGQGKFPGWASLKAGAAAPFFFLFVSAEGGKGGLRNALGEAAFTGVRNRLRLFLRQQFEPSGAQLWIETESAALLLVPPRAPLIQQAVVAALKILMAAPAAGFENLGLPFPARFTFALHYGKTAYHEPGKTGTLVSDAVNFIFHLGTRRAEPGRLTLSGETPAQAIPQALTDMFVRAGEFEGRPLVHSRLFFTPGKGL